MGLMPGVPTDPAVRAVQAFGAASQSTFGAQAQTRPFGQTSTFAQVRFAPDLASIVKSGTHIASVL